MPDRKPDFIDPSQQRQMATSRWENEGGAGPCGPNGSLTSDEMEYSPHLSNTDLVQLRVRVIALENLMIMLLAETSDRQLDLTREMAAYISPRPGFKHHPLTIRAAAEMINLVERAGRFRS